MEIRREGYTALGDFRGTSKLGAHSVPGSPGCGAGGECSQLVNPCFKGSLAGMKGELLLLAFASQRCSLGANYSEELLQRGV